MEWMRKDLADGVCLTYLHAEKFKTGVLSVNLLSPLAGETAAMDSLLGAVLRRGCARYPDMKAIAGALDLLYGAQLDFAARKKAERMCVGFVASFIDDQYTVGGEKLLEPVTELLGLLLGEPLLENGAFCADYVAQEKDNLIDAIRGLVNDKREWADYRLMRELCAGEPYGVSRLGEESDVAAVTPEGLYAHYLRRIAHAPIELFYCGSASFERVEAALCRVLEKLHRGSLLTLAPVLPHAARTEVRRITEHMEVTQGKLAMGFACTAEDVPAMILANTLFGGSSNSKLFLNVREKLSLCYYASSGYHRSKGIVTVSSGVEFKNFQKAYDEILTQLAAVQRGALEEWELLGARSTVRNSFRTMSDSQGRMEDFMLGERAVGSDKTAEEYLRELESVSLERILAAANTMQLDTVYFLTGKGVQA